MPCAPGDAIQETEAYAEGFRIKLRSRVVDRTCGCLGLKDSRRLEIYGPEFAGRDLLASGRWLEQMLRSRNHEPNLQMIPRV